MVSTTPEGRRVLRPHLSRFWAGLRTGVPAPTQVLDHEGEDILVALASADEPGRIVGLVLLAVRTIHGEKDGNAGVE